MLYALIGEETLLIKRALDRLLKERLDPANRDFNFDRFDGDNLELRRLLELARTLPLFAERRIIILRDADELKKSDMETLEKFIPEIPETTDLILVAGKIDKRFSFWQRVEKAAKMVVCKPLYPREVPGWIVQEAASQGFRVDLDAAQWMVGALGADLLMLQSALEKLYLLKGGEKRVSVHDVDACVAAFSWKSVFELTDAVGKRDLSKALQLFRRMSQSGESPVGLNVLLARHFRILMKVKEGATAGIPPFFLKDYQQQATQFKKEALAEKMEKIFRADWDLKSSPLGHTLLFERLLSELTH
ncbi:MAG: DNA polymerase III subunit delta [Deltaproteobacteria bacterium]|nr:DNA polymerase III subunit delta [Deltaproteobacteria bacterium]